MKIAEALNIRADLQKRLAQLRVRLSNNAKIQEGDTPAEDPYLLLQELENLTEQLELTIKLINKTNTMTIIDAISITDMIARKDVLSLKISILRDFVVEASSKIDRYSNKEIKVLSTINVSEKQKYIDKLSRELRELDTKIQGLNWTTDIIE